MTPRPTNTHIYIDEVMTDYCARKNPDACLRLLAYYCICLALVSLLQSHEMYSYSSVTENVDQSRQAAPGVVTVYVFERTISLGVSYACCVHARHLDLSVARARRITSAPPGIR